MTNRRSRLTLLCVPFALAAMVSSCSSATNADSTSTTTIAPETTQAVTTTHAPTTTTRAPSATTEASTTPSTTTTSTTTTSTTTTEAPTTTLAINVEVVGAFPGPVPVVGVANGIPTAVVQGRLSQLGFWNGDRPGRYGFSTKQAVIDRKSVV